MNNYTFRIYIITLLFLPLIGCNKFLDKVPDNRTELNTAEKMSKLLTSAYPNRDYITFCESMTDNATYRSSTPIYTDGDGINLNPYKFEDYTSTQEGSPDEYWASCYHAIAAANEVLAAIKKSANPSVYESQKGEALLARAYAHFMLVSLFAKTYDSTTADMDPGIPYVTEPETELFKDYNRGTVKQVYDMIENDILTGIPLINDNSYTIKNYHFNKKAAYTFASRFYLFKKQYSKVIQYAGLAFPQNSIGSWMRPYNTYYKEIGYVPWTVYYTSSNEKANLLLAPARSVAGRVMVGYQYGLNQNLYDNLYFDAPNPANVQWAFNVYFFSADYQYACENKLYEKFVYTNVAAGIGNPFHNIPILTTEEALFNRMEAAIYLNQFDNAIADMNLFVSMRANNYNPSTDTLTLAGIKSTLNIANDTDALLAEALFLKRLEYMQTGMRWFDILRHKIAVSHVVDAEGKVVVDIGPQDPRRVLQIPSSAVAAGIPANPR